MPTNIQNMPELKTFLDDIEKKLKPIEDKNLSVELLEQFKQLKIQQLEKAELIAENNKTISELSTQNRQLNEKVTAHIKGERPDSDVTYDGIKPTDELINKFL